MVLVLRKAVLLNQVCKNALRQSSRSMCKANPADSPDYNPDEHHHWAKPPKTPRWMQNKTLKTIALFGDEAVTNNQKKMREARLMAEAKIGKENTKSRRRILERRQEFMTFPLIVLGVCLYQFFLYRKLAKN